MKGPKMKKEGGKTHATNQNVKEKKVRERLSDL